MKSFKVVDAIPIIGYGHINIPEVNGQKPGCRICGSEEPLLWMSQHMQLVDGKLYDSILPSTIIKHGDHQFERAAAVVFCPSCCNTYTIYMDIPDDRCAECPCFENDKGHCTCKLGEQRSLYSFDSSHRACKYRFLPSVEVKPWMKCVICKKLYI